MYASLPFNSETGSAKKTADFESTLPGPSWHISMSYTIHVLSLTICGTRVQVRSKLERCSYDDFPRNRCLPYTQTYSICEHRPRRTSQQAKASLSVCRISDPSKSTNNQYTTAIAPIPPKAPSTNFHPPENSTKTAAPPGIGTGNETSRSTITLRLYNTTTCKLKAKINHDSSLSDVCFGRSTIVYSSGFDGSICSNNLATEKIKYIGKHTDAAQSVCWSSARDCLYSGSWDKTIRLWDTRNEGRAVTKYTLPKKIISMDLRDNLLAVAALYQYVYVYDIRKMDKPMTTIDNKSTYQLKAVRVMTDCRGIVHSSAKGRIDVNFFGENGKGQNYTFTSNKIKENGVSQVFPVNSISFHPVFGTFAVGGSSGDVSIWDGVNRRRVRQFSKYSEQVSNVAFNCDGTQLAIASSYTYDEGDRPYAPDCLYIRKLGENDYKPKPATNTPVS
ncbi:hypothetical protein [Absidia glauca]|uniref:Uncharacterized protein n=1 Tax=Absidia glauca TaxID=4829 RepID=A0A168L8S3_ABSGL|nr:hypothetical protein [Absidia glauca]